jgi:carboxylesterase
VSATIASAAPSTPTRVDPSPFDLRAAVTSAPERAAALCLHGLTGTPWEVRSLGEALAARGIRARGPALPGHNSTPETLAILDRDTWSSSVRDEYRRLRGEHQRVFLVGVSLGGLLSLSLAANEPVDGLVVVGTPLRLRQPIPFLLPLLKRLMPMLPKRGGSDIRDAEARARHPGYAVMPLRSVHELVKLQKTVRAALAEITAPILVAHGAHDSTASPRDAELIHDSVSSEIRDIAIFAESAHVVSVDHDGPELAARVSDFLVARI